MGIAWIVDLEDGYNEKESDLEYSIYSIFQEYRNPVQSCFLSEQPELNQFSSNQ